MCINLVHAADWPQHRANAARTGFSPQSLTLPLAPLWQHQAQQPPRPAWPPPARRSYWQRLDSIEPRLADDWTFHPVANHATVFQGSSTEDHVLALNLATGQPRWRFVTDGPVRYAPALGHDLVFAGSDDGWIYALRTADGTCAWKYRLAPEDRRIPGNGRLISAWPVRTGLVLDDDTVYALAGLYPGQGVFAVALDARTGVVRWHQRLEDSPQGYLMASPQHLVVPTGRGNPFALNRLDGSLSRRYDGVGGSYALIADQDLVAGRGNDGTLAVSQLESETRERLVQFQGRHLVVSPTHSYLLGQQDLSAIDRLRHRQLTLEIQQLQRQLRDLQSRSRQTNTPPATLAATRQQLAETATLLDQRQQDRQATQRWKITTTATDALMATDNALILGGTNLVALHDPASGALLWSAPVQGRALGLAVSHGHLLVSTDQGFLHTFSHPASPSSAPSNTPPPQATSSASPPIADLPPALEQWLSQQPHSRGYALVLGLVHGDLAAALARHTDLTVVALDPRPEVVRAVRERLHATGDYGRRVTVHQVDADRLPFTDYCANLIVSESGWDSGEPTPWPSTEIQRVLRPFGGTLWLHGQGQPTHRGPLDGAGAWTHQFANPANTSNSGDTRIRRELLLQWFGGPGPSRMVDRHLRAPAPLAAQGLLLIPGENSLIAVDAYNGTELWSLDLPDSQRFSMPYDAGYLSFHPPTLAVAVRDQCWLIHTTTGTRQTALGLPAGAGEPQDHWGYTALMGDRLYGTAQTPTASRTQPSYQQIDIDYNNLQPLVTSRALFALDTLTRQPTWIHRRGSILNTTLTLDPHRFYFLESRHPLPERPQPGRHPLADLIAAQPTLVALNTTSGAVTWEIPLPDFLQPCQNVLYLVAAGDRLIAVGSRPHQGDTEYRVLCLDATHGHELWRASHLKGLPGEFTHGEQVHHPLVLGSILFAEPAAYDLATGRPLSAAGQPEPWRLRRPGHSCGTVSGAADCLFFRAGNPTVLDLPRHLESQTPPLALSPTRTGCWINIIPASGLVLIPEASAGCVCHFSLQTSMAFLPVP
jgi:outer membrane protein assembly factor BamB